MPGWPGSPGSRRRAPPLLSELESALFVSRGDGLRSAERDAVLQRVQGSGRRGGRTGWDGTSREGKRGRGLPGGCEFTRAPSAAAAARADRERGATGTADSPGCPPRGDTEPACIPPRAGWCLAHARPPLVSPPALGDGPTARRCPRVSQLGRRFGAGAAPLCDSRKWLERGEASHALPPGGRETLRDRWEGMNE